MGAHFINAEQKIRYKETRNAWTAPEKPQFQADLIDKQLNGHLSFIIPMTAAETRKKQKGPFWWGAEKDNNQPFQLLNYAIHWLNIFNIKIFFKKKKFKRK